VGPIGGGAVKIRLPKTPAYWLARTAIAGALLLPERLGYGVVSVLARTYFVFARKRRRVALHTLRNAFPDLDDKARLRYARNGTIASFKVVLDWMYTNRHMSRGRCLREFIDVSEVEAIAPKNGFIAVTGHLGSWEMGAAAMALLEGEVHVIGRALKNPRMQAFVERNRRAVGLHVHPRRGGVRPVTRALRENKIVLMAVDQNQRHRGVFVPFFGELASTERSTVTLAMRYQKPIVVGRTERIGKGYRFRVVADPPYQPPGRGEEAAVIAAAADVNRRLERHILACPDQYLWIHDRYKTRPPTLAPAAPVADPPVAPARVREEGPQSNPTP